MTGYCSNSPHRCENAKSLILLTTDDESCPHCGLALVPALNDQLNPQVEQRLFQLGLGLVVVLTLLAVYLTY